MSNKSPTPFTPSNNNNSLFLEGAAGDEAGEALVVLLALAVRLPPAAVRLLDHVQDVALAEADAQLAARDVGVLLRVVVEMRLVVNLYTNINCFSDGTYNYRKLQ